MRLVGREISNDSHAQQIAKSAADRLHAVGKKVIIAFGGAAGTDISASTKLDSRALSNIYLKTIDTYHVDELDFDLEGDTSLAHYDVQKITDALALIKNQLKERMLRLSLHCPLIQRQRV